MTWFAWICVGWVANWFLSALFGPALRVVWQNRAALARSFLVQIRHPHEWAIVKAEWKAEHETCHCGAPVAALDAEFADLGPAAQALCIDCLPIRCDVAPDAQALLGEAARITQPPADSSQPTTNSGETP